MLSAGLEGTVQPPALMTRLTTDFGGRFDGLSPLLGKAEAPGARQCVAAWTDAYDSGNAAS
jgi:hypothetical protein